LTVTPSAVRPAEAPAEAPRPQLPPAAAVETVIIEEKTEVNDDECNTCGDPGGRLISCSFCPRSFHYHCLDKKTLVSLLSLPLARDTWACLRKVCKVQAYKVYKVPVPSLRNPVTISVHLSLPQGSLSSLRCERRCPDRRLWLGSDRF
jgi:hypothetical protein